MSNVSAANDATAPARSHKLASIRQSIKIALVGGFRPTHCGIATFTTDVYEQLQQWLPNCQVEVYAMLRAAGMPVSNEAAAVILQHDIQSYRQAAERMNRGGVDVVWIQHEFGIFGGECGEYVLELFEAVAAPVCVTLHSVLEQPSPKQRETIERMKAKASRFVVMSAAGKSCLETVYGVRPSIVHVVEHGAPDRPHTPPFTGARPRIMTFGLLGPGKGLETAIRALPAIIEKHPGTIYRIVGASHPNIVAVEGETYRERLKVLANELNVAASIEWVDRFLETDELIKQLAECDIYLTPYPNLAQSTSGTLAYAVALGCAVVSTPYVHARELLSDGVGCLVPPNEPQAIAECVNELLGDPAKLQDMRVRAYARGRSTVWPRFAKRCGEMIADMVPHVRGDRGAGMRPTRPSPQAVLRLIDDVGMIQHTRGVIPDRNHGYSIDDNARALMLMNLWGEKYDDLAIRLCAFIEHAWNGDVGRFRNFMGYDRRWLEATGSEDSNGRTILAIGHTARQASDDRIRQWAMGIFNRSVPRMAGICAPRAMAFLALGATHVLAIEPSNAAAATLAATCAERFASLPLRGCADQPDWAWFEPMLTYDNARIPEALMALGVATGKRELVEIGLAKLRWLIRIHTSAKGLFRSIGSDTFTTAGATRPFDQQPLEAWAMIDACAKAMSIEPRADWQEMAHKAYAWYLGQNDRGIAIANPTTGSCFDGLTATGVNTNSGAESVLSFSHAYQALMRMSGGRAGDVETIESSRAKLISS